MEFHSPPTGLGALMPPTEFAAPMIDWTHTNPFDSTEANRPLQANDESQLPEQWFLGQNPTDTQTHNNQFSLDTISEPSRLLLDQNSTTETPTRSVDDEKTAAAQASSSGDHYITIEDDDDAAGTITAAATTASNTSSVRSPVSPRQPTPPAAGGPEPPKKRQRRRQQQRGSGDGGDGDDGGEGRGSTEAARAKNRLAAMKCRRKKKVEERGLEERQRRLHLQRAVLREAADVLVHEVLALKHEVLRHAACGFTPLDHYIAGAAARGSVSSASSSASAP